MQADLEKVAQVLREAAEFEILPRFGKLKPSDIHSKGGRDVVTTADFESEHRIKEGLAGLFPDTAFIGEEEADKNPEMMQLLDQDRPVWVVDPLDGTRNFSKNKPCFAIIVALIERGETRAGWIFDPVANVMVVAAKGRGAWVGDQRLKLNTQIATDQMTGSLPPKLGERLRSRKQGGEAAIPEQILRYGCVGREYIDLGLSKLHFAMYGGKLKPWDHAAGVLIHAEAGGVSAMIDDRGHGHTPYQPTHVAKNPHLLLAPNQSQWDALHSLLRAG